MGFREWLEEKGKEFMDRHTANTNNGGVVGMQTHAAMQDELGVWDGEVNESAMEDLQNRNKLKPTFNDLLESYKSGEITAKDFQELIASEGIKLTGSQLDWLNGALSDQNTQEAYDRDVSFITDSAKATYEASAQLGLNPTGYLMSQGAATNPHMEAAESNMQTTKEKRFAEFNRNTQMARTMIGIIGGLASSGIYGGAMSSAKMAASRLTAAASKYATDQKYSHIKTKYYDRKNGFINEYYG